MIYEADEETRKAWEEYKLRKAQGRTDEVGEAGGEPRNVSISDLMGDVEDPLESTYGAFCLTTPPPGYEQGVRISFRVAANGYEPYETTFYTEDYAPSSIKIWGTVTNEKGEPIPGATVTLTDPSKTATTDASGSYQLYVETVGTKPYADELDWVLEQSPVTLQITADPLCFKTKGDEVEVTITVLDSESRAVIGEPVKIEPQQISIEGLLELTTDATGSVRFTATHLDAQLFEYTYIVRAREVEKTFTLPVFGARVELNRDAVPPFEPYRGVVADDESRLKIFLNFPDTQDDIVRVNPPPIGTLAQIKNGQEEDVVSTIFLDGLGRAQLVYTPPAYLSDHQLDHSVDVHDYDNAALARGAKVNLVFEYTDKSGNPGTDALEFGVYRPPVLLLHGFLGGLGTWTDFAKHLEPQFDAVLGEYFVIGDDTDDIRANARRLKSNIEQQKIDYAFSAIMLHKVDLVVHSMGGLISRNYIEQAGDYGDDVRKLLMVATPNHGSSLLDIKLGALAALLFDKHKVASQQLYSGSDFIKRLNAGEQTGAHLANNVQYANLIGKMHCYPPVHDCWPGPWRETDGVVTTASARLNGVVSYLFEGTKHSGDLVVYPLDESVTTDGRIWAKIIQLLQEDITPAPIRGSRMEITKARGDVVLNPDTLAIPVSSTPTRLEPWASLRTGADGEAVIALTIDDNVYGKIFLHYNSEILFDYASPDYVRVFLRRGSALFRSFRQEGAGLIYDLPLGVQPYEGKWYEINPKARVTHRDTEFVVNIGQDIQVFSLDGRVVVETYDNEGTATFQELTTDQGATVQENGVLQPVTAMPEAWWENSFYQLEPLEDQGTATVKPFGLGDNRILLFAGSVSGVLFALLLFLLVTRRKPSPAAPPVTQPARPVRPRGRPEEFVSRRPPARPDGPPERLGGGKPSGPPETLD